MRMTKTERRAVAAARIGITGKQPPIRKWAPGRPNWLWCETPTPGREDGVCGVLLPVGHRCHDCGKTRAPYAAL